MNASLKPNALMVFEELLHMRTMLLLSQTCFLSESKNTEFFHHTNMESAANILSTRTFHASHVRSTSDPLEFALPFSICRDWLTNKFIHFPNFPVDLFKHFNEEGQYSKVKMYFVSLTAEKDSRHLRSMYGESLLRFELTSFLKNQTRTGSIIKCAYHAKPIDEIETSLDQWRTIFEEVVSQCGIKEPQKHMGNWFYIFMRFCHVISMSSKQSAFSNEKEVKLIFFPDNADVECAEHGRRATKPLFAHSLLVREFLPINLDALGIEIKRLR